MHGPRRKTAARPAHGPRGGGESPGVYHPHCAEEGASKLTHAVSRVDLICHNGGSQPQEVTVHLDLSGDGARTNRDSNPFGGMPPRRLRLHSAARSKLAASRRQDGGLGVYSEFSGAARGYEAGPEPVVHLRRLPALVRTLPAHPHLKRDRVATSDGGLKHWELTISDFSVPRQQKRQVFWHAREHAYESFSSFAMEGLLTWLLSDAAAEARRRFVFTIHPMTNVDGVADGCEYRGGYDHAGPRATRSARLVFDTLDRLRPDYIVTWHNWVAPRNVDCLFYTDQQGGKPSRRAWDRFTQRFRSPRAVGHRWEDESQPLRKNWFGRDLTESNPHQYAMKRYGSAVWGWEMPWWRRTVDDARQSGAAFAQRCSKRGGHSIRRRRPPRGKPRPWRCRDGRCTSSLCTAGPT